MVLERVEWILWSWERDYFVSLCGGDMIVYDLSSICKGFDGSGLYVFLESEILNRVRSVKKLEV